MTTLNQVTTHQVAQLDLVAEHPAVPGTTAPARSALHQYQCLLVNRLAVLGWAAQGASNIAGKPQKTLQGQGAYAPVRRLRKAALPSALFGARLRRLNQQQCQPAF